MKTFSFTCKDSFFPQSFNGTIQADSIQEATQLIKEEYALNLDTTQEEIEVISIEQVATDSTNQTNSNQSTQSEQPNKTTFTSLATIKQNIHLFQQIGLDHFVLSELSRVRNNLTTEQEAITFLNNLYNSHKDY
jgi:hypothetical protein